MKFIAAILVCGGFLPANKCQFIYEHRVIYERMKPCMGGAESMQNRVRDWVRRGQYPDSTKVVQLFCVQAPKGIFTNLEIRP